MKQKSINITNLHYLLSDHVLSKKPFVDFDAVLALQGELVDDPGAQFRSVNLEQPRLDMLFYLTVCQYAAHCICMRLEEPSNKPFDSIFVPYQKKNRELHMYQCIDIMQVHMAKELQEKRALINPMGDVAYL